MVRVLKRDRTAEDFSQAKLAASLWRAMQETTCGTYRQAHDLAGAIELYIVRNGWTCLSTAAVFEMAVKVLRRVHLGRTALAMESFRFARSARRRKLRVAHQADKTTYWEKGWLAKVGCQSWGLLPSTARIIAGCVEAELLGGEDHILLREYVLDRFNHYVSQFGLADAVPVQSAWAS